MLRWYKSFSFFAAIYMFLKQLFHFSSSWLKNSLHIFVSLLDVVSRLFWISTRPCWFDPVLIVLSSSFFLLLFSCFGLDISSSMLILFNTLYFLFFVCVLICHLLAAFYFWLDISIVLWLLLMHIWLFYTPDTLKPCYFKSLLIIYTTFFLFRFDIGSFLASLFNCLIFCCGFSIFVASNVFICAW